MALTLDRRATFALIVLASFASAFVAATRAEAHRALLIPACKAPAKFRGIHANNYETNCIVCSLHRPKGVAKEYRIRSSDPVTVAEQYARKAYQPAFRQAVFEGCLRGFRLRR